MNIYEMSLSELFELREQFLLEGFDTTDLSELIFSRESDYIDSIYEDGDGGAGSYSGGVGYANASIGGMGQVVPSQPSIYAGSTTEPAYSAGGGRSGSGDISMPYNPGGRKKVFQKMAAPMSDRKGASKRRRNKVFKNLKNIFANRQDYTSGQGKVKSSKIMNFDNFEKDQFTRVTKVSQ